VAADTEVRSARARAEEEARVAAAAAGARAEQEARETQLAAEVQAPNPKHCALSPESSHLNS
jgi:hypothetical protein